MTANMYCIGKRDLSNHTQMCTIQLNVTGEYSKTSTVDQKIPLKIFFVDITRALLPLKNSSRSSGLYISETSAKTFPIEMKSIVDDVECPIKERKKERKKRKRNWEEEKANVSLLRIPRKNASLLPRP